MKSITPLLHVQDMVESLAFYQVLGFDLEQRVPEEGPPSWVYLVRGSVHLMLQETEQRQADARLEGDIEQGMVLHMGHGDIVDFYHMLQDVGMPVSDMDPSGLLEFMIRDPDGYTLVFFLDEG